MYECQEQLTYKIIQSLMLEFPQLEVDMVKQLSVKNRILKEVYEFDIHSKTTSIVKSDVHEWVSYFMACKKLKGLSDKTLYNYKLLFDKFEKHIVKPIRMITPMDIRSFMVELLNTQGAESVCNKLITINDFFEFVKDECAIDKNPCSKIEKPKFQKHVSAPLNQTEQEILRNSCETPKEKAFFELLISSGIRVGELCAIKMEDINLENRTLFVTNGKGGKSRTVKFSTKAKIDIKNYIVNKKNKEYLFETDRRPYNKVGVRSMQELMKKIVNRSGLEGRIFCHRLRTTTASNAIKLNVPITSIQKLLGHSNCDTSLKFYAKLSNETMFNDYDKVYQ